MDYWRRISLAWLAAGAFLPAAMIKAAAGQDAQRRVIDVRIRNRKVVTPGARIRITEGSVVELRWTSDEPLALHLHGYDIELHVRRNEPAVMVIDARVAGRFPITSHGWGSGRHGHGALTYLEIYPR